MKCCIEIPAWKLKASYLMLLPACVTLASTVVFSHHGWAAEPDKTEDDKNNAAVASIEYNPSFIHGSGIDISRFTEGNPALPGQYDVTVAINGKETSKKSILFVVPAVNQGAQACLTAEQLKQLGIKLSDNTKMPELRDAKARCAFIEDWVDQSSSRFNSGDFYLDLTLPQINVVQIPNGYIDPSLWEAGNTLGFLDYNGNVYSSFQGARGYSERQNSYNGNLNLFAGFNFGDWRVRKRLNTTWDSGRSPKTHNLLGYVQRDITPLNAELTLGESSTTGDIFESFSLRGAMLNTDDRMLPDSLRQYTPVIRGIAETNAKVTVMQRGLSIYETVVPPGPFQLSDIGTMGYGGDLVLVVTEADGRQRRQEIPFSAPPRLLHEGVSNFAVAAGQLKDEAVSKNPGIFQGTYRYGVANGLTLFGGAQLGQRYRSVALGNAFNTSLGGFSIDVTRAWSDLHKNSKASGNSYQVNYTKHLDSMDTNLTLAAYRYSSRGFYTFREASQDREGRNNNDMLGSDYRTKHRFTATINQPLTNSLSLYFTGSMYTYWGGRSDSRQYSVTLNQSLKWFNYGLTMMRSRNESNKEENSVMLTLSVPLGRRTVYSNPLFNSLYTTASHNNNGSTQFQTMVNGSQGEQSELNYGLGASMANSSGNTRGNTRDRSVTGNLNYQSGFGRLGATGSVSNHNHQQLSLSGGGSLVAHSGGITAGPSIGDSPFAVIGAKGAKGAKLLNGYGGRIDGNGYAIMPSLTPYRENEVSLDPRGLPENVDILESGRKVVPRQGAGIVVNMRTIIGTPMILIVKDQQQNTLPIGTDLLNEDDVSQGIIGQGGQAFIRGWDPQKQVLYANTESGKVRCVPRTMPVDQKGKVQQIQQVEVICSRSGH